MPTKTHYPHILVNDHGIPIIEGTSMKVIELVAARDAYGWSPEELQFQYPYLMPSQIHSALAYYWDHREELDRELARQLRAYDAQRTEKAAAQSPLRQRLRDKGLL